ncbi:copper chaperone PCu(A)C [Streptomyces sp. NPDC090106]|uniref:copper chaperone PCu(A)C n=1 Tax=Streptomyces sp. NPDC090106 TaxID=3365946 RepID=UPI003828907E
MTDRSLWRPTRRRLTDALLAAFVPVAAFSLALGGLTTWVTAGKAGSPARVAVSSGQILLPYGDSNQTAAFFTITNAGGADDRLVSVTSSGVGGEIYLSQHRMVGSTAAYRESVASITVRAGGKLSMSPQGLDLIVPPKEGWEAGDLVSFTFHFERSGPVKTLAAVALPVDLSF